MVGARGRPSMLGLEMIEHETRHGGKRGLMRDRHYIMVCFAGAGMVGRRTLWFLAVAAASGVAGCGSSSGANGTNSAAVAAIGRGVRHMLTNLERGDYTVACEAFTLRSRYGMAVAAGMDGHESDSSCSNVFIVAGALDNLGLVKVGHALKRDAATVGLIKDIELPEGEIHKLLHGIGRTNVFSFVDNMEIKGSTARYRGTVVARREGRSWFLEALGPTKTSYIQDREDVERKCVRLGTKEYQRLCRLLKAVVNGSVLSDTRHRELDHLLPLLFRQPKLAMLERAMAHHR
jgi:hypothetical protein